MPTETAATSTEASVEPSHPQTAPPAAGEGSAAASAPEAPASNPVREIGDLARRRSSLSNRARQVRESERAVATREKAMAAEREETRREIAELRAQLQGNPLKRPGVDPEKAIQELLAEGTPEARTIAFEKRLQASEDARIALEKRLEEKDAERAKKEQSDAQAREAAHTQRNLDTFTNNVTSGAYAAKLPHLNAEFSKTEIRAMAAQLDSQSRTQKWKDAQGNWHTGASYTFEEVANFLEDHAREVHKVREDRRKAILGGSQEPSPAPTQRAKASPGNGLRAPGQTTRVVESTAAKPPRIQARLTREQEMEADLAMLRKANAADAAAKRK